MPIPPPPRFTCVICGGPAEMATVRGVHRLMCPVCGATYPARTQKAQRARLAPLSGTVPPATLPPATPPSATPRTAAPLAPAVWLVSPRTTAIALMGSLGLCVGAGLAYGLIRALASNPTPAVVAVDADLPDTATSSAVSRGWPGGERLEAVHTVTLEADRSESGTASPIEVEPLVAAAGPTTPAPTEWPPGLSSARPTRLPGALLRDDPGPVVDLGGRAVEPPTPQTPQADADERGNPDLVTVRLHTFPVGAEIRVDGQARGRTPAKLMLPPGRYQLDLLLDGAHTGVSVDATRDRRLCFTVEAATLTRIDCGRIF